MKASILIPAFNAGNTLQATLESCVGQGARVVEEIIVVDDHSTDDTHGVFEAFQRNHPDFHLLWATNPKKGACSARNHALSLSRGPFIQWLDADDLLGRNKIEAQLNALDGAGRSLATCPFRPFNGDPSTGLISDPRDWQHDAESTGADWIAKDPMCIPACWLGSRNLMLEAGPWDERLQVNQDGEFFCRVIAKSDQVIFDDSIETFYRREGGGVSTFTAEKAESLFRSIQSMERTGLELEDSDQMRQMVSNRYQAFIYTVFPSRRDLLNEAKKKLQALPKPTISNPNAVSPTSRAISRILGWKSLTRLRQLKQHLTA